MLLQRLILSGLSVFLGAMALGCGPSVEYYAPAPDPYYERVLHGSRSEPSTDLERELLEACASTPYAEPVIVGEGHASAGAAYAAASGIVCRQVELSEASAPSLACGDGVDWYFVPDVFGEGAGSSPSR